MSTHLINNQWHTGQGPAFNSVNPSNGEIVWQGNGANAEQVDSAINAARAAQVQWADMPIESRITILENFVAQLKEHTEEFAAIIARETGKPLWETRTEVGAMTGKSSHFYHYNSAIGANRKIQCRVAKAFIRHKPHGVVAIRPYNFPGIYQTAT
ncbi:aldehyde dehydrogenase family protein (plasmid) [Pseudoalteromonas espejiana]